MRRGALPGGGREAHALRYVRLVSLPSDRAHLRRLEGAVVRDHGRPSPVRGVQGLTSLTAPTLQLLAWIAERETCGYAETIEAWRSSCPRLRSEEHTSELQSPYVISYAVFCLKKKK